MWLFLPLTSAATDTTSIDSIYNELIHMQQSIASNDYRQDCQDIDELLDYLDTILYELEQFYIKEEWEAIKK